MLGKRLINTVAGAAPSACTTDTLDLEGIPAGSCVAYYKLDSTAADVTGNYDGTATNVTYTNSGQFSQAAVFNGSNSRLQLNQHPTASLFTASMWINFNDVTTAQNILGNITATAYAVGWTLGIASGKITLITGNDTSAPWEMIKTYDFVFSTNTWYHLVLVSNGASTNDLYVNGSVSTFTGTPPQIALNNAGPNIEISFGGGVRVLNGKIDQVRFFNKALDSGEVAQLANE